MKKRILSMALCVMMLVSVLPLSAFSTGAADAAACTCTAACTEGAMNAECPVCSAEGATAAQCALHSPAPAAATQAAAQSAPAMTNAAAPAAAVNDSTSAANGGASGDNPAPAANGGAGGNDSTPAANVGAGADDSTSATDGGAASDPSSAASAPADTTEATVAPAADAAVTAAQAQIDALPTAEALAALMTAMNDAEDNGDAAAYAEAEAQFGAANDSYAAARAAYDALPPDQQALIDTALLNAFEAFLAEYYSADTLTGGGETPSGTESKVAQIGDDETGTKYDKLSDALEAATDGCTIKLLKDITSESNLGFSNEVNNISATIDLNGKKITNTVELHSSIKSLTIKDNSDSKNGSITVKNPSNTTVSLTVEGGNVTFTGAINSIEAKGGTLTIASEAPTDSSANVSSLKVENTGTTVNIQSGKVNIESVANATVNITDGEVTLHNTNSNYAIGGSLKVSGGTLTIPNYTVTGLIVSDNGNVNITGGKVENPYISGGTVNISGGTIAKGDQVNNKVDYPAITGGELNITGGTVETLTATGGNIDVKAGGTLNELKVVGGEAAVTLTGEAPTSADKPNVGTLNVSDGSINIQTTAPLTGYGHEGNNDTFNIKTLNVTGGTATVEKGRINTLEVKNSGVLNFKGDKDVAKNTSSYCETLTVSGGTANVHSCYINTLKLNSGTLNIHKEAQGSSSAISVLQYAGGTLTFVNGKDDTGKDVEFDKSQSVVGQLYVSSGNPNLTNGVFTWLQTGIENSDLLDLLADGFAIFDKDGKVCDAKIGYNTSSNFTDKDPFHIAAHDCDKYNAETEHNYTKNADGKYYCDCGRECKHTNVDATGKCAKCAAEFFAKGEKDGTTEYYTKDQFLSSEFKFKGGYAYTLYGDIALGEAALTPGLTVDIHISFNLNKHSVSGTINLGDSTHTLGLTINGEGDLSGAKFVVKNGSALGLPQWRGDKTEGGKGLTLGGLNMSAVSTADNAKKITVHSGMTITDFTGGDVTVKDWLGGSETGVAPYLMLKVGDAAQQYSTRLSTLSGVTVTIAECKNHSVTDNTGTCQYCGHTFVAKLTTGTGEDTQTKYFEYKYTETSKLEDPNHIKKVLANAFTAASYVTSGSNTLTLLADVDVHSDGGNEDFKINSGTFTLDLNGRKIGETLGTSIRICSKANVTITDNSGNSGNSGYLAYLYVGGSVSGDQGGTVTIESGNFKFVNPNYGTVNIKGGKTEELNVSNGGVANVSNADDGTIPEITTLKYNSSESTGTVSLQGGKYKTIDASAVTGKKCNDLLDVGYAYYTTDIDNTGLVQGTGNKLPADSATGTTYYVREHECTPDESGACTCGRVFVATLTTGAGEGATTAYYEALQSALNAAKDTAAADNVTVTLLSNNPTTESGDIFIISGGKFTLDFNDKSVNSPVKVVNGNVTITGKNAGTGTVQALTVGMGGEATNSAVVTIESGKFNSIGVSEYGNLTFNGGKVEKNDDKFGTLIISDGTATVTGGTINAIDVGASDAEDNPSGSANNGSGTLSVTGGTITALNYYCGTSVTLTGGQFTKINGNAAGYNSTIADQNANYNKYAKDVVDFLGDGVAYYTSADGDNTIVKTTDDSGNQLKVLATEGTTYYVRSHTCTYENVDTELYHACDCGRVCHHPDGKVGPDGVCGVCNKQLPIKETDKNGDLVRYLTQFPAFEADDSLKGGHTYTLMADLTGNAISLNSTRSDLTEGSIITIDLNGKKLGAGDVTLNIACPGATVAITGNGDLSKVTLSISGENKLDLSGWLGAPTTNDLTIGGLKIQGKNTEITLKDGLIFNTIGFTADSTPPPTGQGGNQGEQTGGSTTSTAPAFTAGDLLRESGFKLVTVSGEAETDVEYSAGIGSDANIIYKVVKCPHTANADGKCKHCGLSIVASLTPAGEGATTTYYTSVDDALAAACAEANSGCTVKLLANATTNTQNVNGTFTLDLNGKTLTVNGAFNANGGNITLTDSATTKGELKCSSFKLNASDNDVFTIDGANVSFIGENNKDFKIEQGKLVVKSGKIDGTLAVNNGGALTVRNTDVTIGEGETATTTTLVPEIAKLVVNGGTVKLSGGKYGYVGVTDTSGKKLGELLVNDDSGKYGFKVTKTESGAEKHEWYDASLSQSTLSINPGNNTLTVEKLPIQSITTAPADGKQTITYMNSTNLQITEINSVAVGSLTEVNAPKFQWWHIENGNKTELNNSTSSAENIFTQSLTALTGGEKHELYCDVTVDGYTKTVKFEVTVQKKKLNSSEITAPDAQQNLRYKPLIENNKYTGKGELQQLMNSDKYSGTACSYEYSLDGKTWSDKQSFKQSEAGTYKVYWRVHADQNHTIDGKEYYEAPTTVKVTMSPLEITEVRVEKLSAVKTYDGNTKLPTQGDDFNVVLVYQEEVYFDTATKEITLGDGRKNIVELEYDEKNVGTRNIVAKLKSGNFKFAGNAVSVTARDANGQNNATGEIKHREIIINVSDLTVAVNQPAPDLSNPKQGEHYTVDRRVDDKSIIAGEGLVKGDALPGVLTLKYYDGNAEVKAPDTSKAGKKYDIKPIFAAATDPAAQRSIVARLGKEFELANDGKIEAGNYLVELQPGKLTVVNNFTITATADAGGTISPYGTVEVAPGASKTFTVTPNPGYVIASVKVDGVNLGSISGYTFSEVDKNHTIHATFMLPWGNPQTGVDVG